MVIARTFIDWNQPLLPAVAEYLKSTYQSADTLDLSNLIIVVPGRRAGRRLVELLVEAASGTVRLVPPQIETLGTLPERLYEPQKPFASHTVQVLAWVQSLQSMPRDRVERIVRVLPDVADLNRWRALGELFWRQHRELAADGLDFNDVVEHGQQLPGFPEEQRWRILHEVQQTYLHTLDQLELWDRQTARLFAIKHDECQTECSILLVGTVDMNRALRDMLQAVESQVSVIVHAPESMANRFDELGCLRPETWQDPPVDLLDEQIRVADGPESQADAVLRALAELNGEWSTDQITIGLADESLARTIQRKLDLAGIPTRWFEGRVVAETSPYRLMAAVGAYLQQPRTAELAELARHPDLERWASLRGVAAGWMTQLDRYRIDHLQTRMGSWLGSAKGHQALRGFVEQLDSLLLPLRGDRRALAEWASPLRELLRDLYRGQRLQRDDAADRWTIEAIRVLQEALTELEGVPSELGHEATAGEAVQLWLDLCRSQAIPSRPVDEAIELLGWLELPLDDAPVLIVTSFNEGHVPKSVNADLFLPNALRKYLEIDDNRRRWARDAYALCVHAGTRQQLRLVVGKRNYRGDPLIPSRLLFAIDEDRIAARVHQILETPVPPDLMFESTPQEPAGSLLIPQPEALSKPLDVISVTAFRTYLACPYRFYLRHVLNLREIDDRVDELEAAAFGTLIHSVLESFGRSGMRESTDAGQVQEYLFTELDRIANETYGPHRLPAVEIQLLQLRPRLEGFAAWQVAQVNEGWRIVETERKCEVNPEFLRFGDHQVRLKGRIDRIDHHPASGAWRLLDYKSSDSASKPAQTHRRRDQWIDLQLPLYRHLVEELQIPPEDISLGYIVLPSNSSKVGMLPADWTIEELAEADECARLVVQSILEGRFGPPDSRPQRLMTEFDRICAAEWQSPQATGGTGGVA